MRTPTLSSTSSRSMGNATGGGGSVRGGGPSPAIMLVSANTLPSARLAFSAARGCGAIAIPF
eukprot:4139471-Prymnesium_polylepis.1